ncbi:MAG: basic secretory protein-like protein [Paludisphaera borealis]|uniref:basic secretory protein-like protein n=1 Tax=Paludisphaera borealis TaxID=1387353 RepID=UPI00284F2524|nr:basic secretory protein-like protein [Paludisphaera borealis]MDR3621394.1 basic secretory protein-like protein [Paludisphaera borealis]
MPTTRRARLFSAILTVWVWEMGGDASAFAEAGPVAAVVESTLATGSDKIRQFAFDGDDGTFFTSKAAPGAEDSFTLVFDEPVIVKAIAVQTGKPDGADALASGTLETSEDGTTFHDAATFQKGAAKAEPGRRLKAIRIRPGKGDAHPLVIREIVVDSNPKVRTFAYPVEIVVDVTEAPEMKAWADNAARTCERWYGWINDQLKSDRYKPIHLIRMDLKNGIDVPAMAGGGRITGSVKWFKDHPDDVGAMIHETVHIVQRYHSRNNPGWLVEGVADYIRFFQYEPANIGRLNPKTARYDGNYRVSARFLAYVSEKYDKDLVLKLNRAMREGSYTENLFKQFTGKTVQELGEEWRGSLQK